MRFGVRRERIGLTKVLLIGRGKLRFVRSIVQGFENGPEITSTEPYECNECNECKECNEYIPFVD
jgi:hypothetical protein